MPLPKIMDKDVIVSGSAFLLKSDVDQLVSALDVEEEVTASYLRHDMFLNEELYTEYLSYSPSLLPYQSLKQVAPHLIEE